MEKQRAELQLEASLRRRCLAWGPGVPLGGPCKPGGSCVWLTLLYNVFILFPPVRSRGNAVAGLCGRKRAI